MSIEAIILDLRQQHKVAEKSLHEWLAAREKEREAMAAEVTKLAAAIAAQEGKPIITEAALVSRPETPIKPKRAGGPTVPSLLLETAKTLPPKAIFTKQSLCDLAQTHFPTHALKLKTGKHNGFKKLINDGIFFETGGGYGLELGARGGN
jgi:hypothetical protein